MQVDQEVIHRPPPRVSFTETFESSQAEKEVKFSIDKLLARGIQENKSSLIVQEQPIGEAQNGPEFDLCHETEKIAFELRNKYDRAKTATTYLEVRIAKMKEQIALLKEEENNLTLLKTQTQENYNQTEANLHALEYEIQEAMLKIDGRKNMEERLKKDILFYKKELFDSTMEQRKRNNELRRLKNSSMREQRLSLRCKNLLVSVEKTVEGNRYQRNRGVQETNMAVSRKREYTRRQFERSMHFQRSMMEALVMKLPEERQLIKMMLAQKFVKKLLFAKMTALMASFAEINDAFTNIKQNTSIKTTEQFLEHYLFKDKIYGELLESIAKAEPKIDKLKQEREALREEQRQLELKQAELCQVFKDKHKREENEKNISMLEELNSNEQKIDKYRNSIMLWGVCLMSMVKKTTRKQIRSKYEYLGDLFGDCIRMLLQILEEEEEKEKSISETRLNSSNLTAQDVLARNMRIKTDTNENFPDTDDVDEQYDMQSEKQYLQASRKYVKKKHVFRSKLHSK